MGQYPARHQRHNLTIGTGQHSWSRATAGVSCTCEPQPLTSSLMRTTRLLQLRSCLTTVASYSMKTFPNDSLHTWTMGLFIGAIAVAHNVSKGRCSWEEWRCSGEEPLKFYPRCCANRSTPRFSNRFQPACTLFHHRNHSVVLCPGLGLAWRVLRLSSDYGASNSSTLNS